jgi:hypothetical protein
MIYLAKGDTNQIIVTLSEKAQLLSPNYLFVFKSRSTNEVIKFIKLVGSDLSINQTRFNTFTIATDTYFGSKLKGEWTYTIYEQASITNLDIDFTTSLIEEGQMTLSDDNVFTFNSYNNQSNTFIVRNI